MAGLLSRLLFLWDSPAVVGQLSKSELEPDFYHRRTTLSRREASESAYSVKRERGAATYQESIGGTNCSRWVEVSGKIEFAASASWPRRGASPGEKVEGNAGLDKSPQSRDGGSTHEPSCLPPPLFPSRHERSRCLLCLSRRQLFDPASGKYPTDLFLAFRNTSPSFPSVFRTMTHRNLIPPGFSLLLNLPPGRRRDFTLTLLY